MKFVGAGIRQVTRKHALLLLCASSAILVLILLSSPNKPIAFSWSTVISHQEDAAVDVALQEAAAAALANRDGAIIVMDAQTGRVRAIVNPQVAYAQALMPGSAIKPFTALAALRAELIGEDSRTVCPGRFTGLNFSLACVHADHLPPFSPSQAIAYSCNYYFATAGQRLGRDRLLATLREFDFGQATGISEDEVSGTLRPCEIGNSSRVRTGESNIDADQADCRERVAVGESDHIQVTPIQLLTAYAALVNGGHLFSPRIASSDQFRAAVRSNINIAPQHRDIIVDGMRGAVRYGTARAAKLDSLPLTIIGKTGTAMPVKGFRSNGWFVGFAGQFQSSGEIEPSQTDLAVLVLLSRAHGSEAATLARPIFETYANEINYRNTEAQSTSQRNAHSGDEKSGETPRSADPTSQIKVHLVGDNVTKTLSLEDYVLGVMRAEGTVESEPEALKALAIAIRTFALKNIGRHATDGYDFCSTTHCQRFVGATKSAEVDSRLPAAVRATEGQLLLDDRGQPIDAYFGASCGGETANIRELWGAAPTLYLRGVRDEYCDAGPHAKWTDTISRADLLRAVQSDSRTDVGNRLDQVLISKRDETGRAEFITLEGERRKTVRGWDFKIIVGRVLGWNVLKSSRFEVGRSGSNFIFRGSGFGHGLGLCQEGAHVMAARGASCQKILEKYFPGTIVKKETERRGDAVTWGGADTEIGRRGDAVTRRCGDKEIGRWGERETERRGVSPQLRITVSPLRPVALSPPLRITATILRPVALSPPLRITASILRPVAPSPPLHIAASHHPSFVPLVRFLTISSEHFSVAYPPDIDRRLVDQILSTLELTRDGYLRRVSSASTAVSIPRLEIRLNESTGDFTSRTGQPWWAAAATQGNRIELQPVRILKQRGVLFTTLRHELAHILIDSVSNKRAPRWLEEGFAIYLAREGQAISRYLAQRRLAEDELEQRLQHPPTQMEMRTLYAEAYLMVAEMIRRQGETGVWNKLSGY
ncbi:MAG TPA: SpoIID/LytB domain-containing protein [Pyrinomonadaceae bacterium]